MIFVMCLFSVNTVIVLLVSIGLYVNRWLWRGHVVVLSTLSLEF